ncbi:MAG: hypothetical protein WBB76_13135 [Gaiellaceae bacterium]
MARSDRVGSFASSLAPTLAQALVCAATATGLLYLVHPHVTDFADMWLRDALPLDELSGRSEIPLPIFAAVWVAAASSIAVFTQGRRVVAFACGVWLVQIVATTTSLHIVRQASLVSAFGATWTVPAVYLAPLLAGTATALVGTLQMRRSGQAFIRLNANRR